MKKIFNDKLGEFRDTLTPGLWAKTEIIVGHDYHKNRFGKSVLGDVISIDHNTVPISGVQAVFQSLFGVKDDKVTISTLHDDLGIGLPNEPAALSQSFLIPQTTILDGAATLRECMYQTGHFVQLFGLGVTGTAENNITVHKVNYRETKIQMDVTTSDGVLNGAMYPFRYTESELDPQERQKYFGKKLDSATGKTGFYLKRFENFPEIKHIWKTQDTMDSDEETLLTNDTVFDFTRDDAINSFIECHLRVTKKDLKEYFQYKLDQPESCRFNTIALYAGRYSEVGKDENEQFGDYTNVQLFSKLNIPTEALSLEKDLEIIYRIYGN